MRIVFGQRAMGFPWLPVVLFFFFALFPIELGQCLLHGPDPAELAAEGGEGPKKMVAGVALLFTFARLRRLSPFLRNLFYAIIGYTCLLCLESYFVYGTPFVYPHVFSKFFVVFWATAVYIAFRGAKEWAFTVAMLLMIAIFIIDITVYYPHVLSIGSFMDVDRGLHASMVFFLLAGFIYSFNTYLTTTKVFWLVVLFACLGLILFLNHRTVWLATITSMALNILLIQLKGKEPIVPTAWTPLIVVPTVAVFFVFAYVFTEKPELLASIVDRITDIEKVNEQGTGKWRIEQFQSYLPFVIDHPLIGMRFEGFELPVQFIAEQTGEEVFVANTGHHFHSFYMDSLFYHGLAGLVLLSMPFINPIYRLWHFPIKPSARLIGLCCWCLIALQYGLSYPLYEFHFAMAGFTLAYMDTCLDKADAEQANLQAQYAEAELPEPEQEFSGQATA